MGAERRAAVKHVSRSSAPESGTWPGAPRVSVVIPAYFSHETVAECLEALRAQSFRDFETIVVNSSPEDRTAEIVTGRFPEVRFEQSPTRLLPHAARNRGVSLARGELLVFTDPDCRPRPDWLEHLVATHAAGHAVVGGSMELASQRCFELGVHLCKFSWALRALPPGPHWIAPTANVLYARRVFEEIGPFDGRLFCGDALQSWRAAALGHRPWFEPRATVEHRHPGNVRSLWREGLTRGREFALTRIRFEGWSRVKAAAYVGALPLLVPLVLVRSGSNAIRARWGRSFLLSFPVQVTGFLAYSLGEARAHLELALGRSSLELRSST